MGFVRSCLIGVIVELEIAWGGLGECPDETNSEETPALSSALCQGLAESWNLIIMI